jgi:hypothetical protein
MRCVSVVSGQADMGGAGWEEMRHSGPYGGAVSFCDFFESRGGGGALKWDYTDDIAWMVFRAVLRCGRLMYGLGVVGPVPWGC